MRRIRTSAAVLLPVALMASLSVGSTAAQGTAETGFATPEDAVRGYLEGVAAADVERILDAAAIEEVAEGFRLDLQTERIRTFIPFISLAPADDPFFVGINEATQASQVLGQARTLAYSLLSDIDVEAPNIRDVDGAWAEAFASQLDAGRLGGLEVIDVRFPDARFADDARYLSIADQQRQVLGADDYVERLALFEFEGRLYDLGLTLLRYADTWKVYNQVSVISGVSAQGGARSTTQEDYDRQTLGD